MHFCSSSTRTASRRRITSSSSKLYRTQSPRSWTAWRATTCVGAASPTTALCFPSSSPSTTCTRSCWISSTSSTRRDVSRHCHALYHSFTHWLSMINITFIITFMAVVLTGIQHALCSKCVEFRTDYFGLFMETLNCKSVERSELTVSVLHYKKIM